MLLFIEVTFIAILGAILFMVYRRESILSKKSRRTASVEEYWSGKERRSHPRFRQKLDVEYTLEKRPNLKAKGYTIDISEGGLKVLMDEKLAKGTSLEFVITLPGKKSPAQIKSEVIWLEEAKAPGPLGKRMFYYGVRFLAIKEPGGSSLLNYIRSIQLSS